jgi:hypothetical protein
VLKLPFHVDSPLRTGFFTLGVCLLFLFLRWGYDRNLCRIGDGLGWLFERKFRMVEPARARRAGRAFLLAMAILFACLAIFGIAVGTGLIENGDPPKLLTIEAFGRFS